jgi:hypothetical protein
MRAGTKIEVQYFDMQGRGGWEAAKIARTMPNMLPLPDGYHPVRFADGGSLLVHASRFRIVDNRN